MADELTVKLEYKWPNETWKSDLFVFFLLQLALATIEELYTIMEM